MIFRYFELLILGCCFPLLQIFLSRAVDRFHIEALVMLPDGFRIWWLEDLL